MKTQFPDCEDGQMLKLLAEHGVIEARITFSGGGDSGAIDGYYVDHISGKLDESKLNSIRLSNGHTLHDHLEHIGDELLQRTGQDWYNNDGGGGTIYITPGTGRIYVAMYVNISQTEDCPVDFSVEVTCDGNPVERGDEPECGQAYE